MMGAIRGRLPAWRATNAESGSLQPFTRAASFRRLSGASAVPYSVGRCAKPHLCPRAVLPAACSSPGPDKPARRPWAALAHCPVRRGGASSCDRAGRRPKPRPPGARHVLEGRGAHLKGFRKQWPHVARAVSCRSRWVRFPRHLDRISGIWPSLLLSPRVALQHIISNALPVSGRLRRRRVGSGPGLSDGVPDQNVSIKRSDV